jgi:hypothetical protein
MARKPAPLVAPAPSSVSTSRPNKFAHLANGVVSERTFAEKKFTITEFADMIGFPVSALETIIDKNRRAIKRPFYNITQLAERWDARGHRSTTSFAKQSLRYSTSPAKTARSAKVGASRLP